MGDSLESYLRKLPGGLGSHPRAMMKASLVRDAVASRPLPAEVIRALPQALAATLVDPPLPTAWLPVTHVVGTLLVIADEYDLDERSFLAWRREQYRALLAGPLYRVLFAVLSPERLVSGAAHKWKSLTRDSLILERVETQRGVAEITISWPEHILPPLVARSLMEGVRAALELSGAQRPAIDLHDLTPTGARYSLRWG